MPQCAQLCGDFVVWLVTLCPAVVTLSRLTTGLCTSLALALCNQLGNGRCCHIYSNEYSTHPIHFADRPDISSHELKEDGSIVQGATVAVGMLPFSCRRAADNLEAGTETEVVTYWFAPSHRWDTVWT